MSTDTLRVGARTEALILLPAALLLLACLSFFTLFSYRSAVDQALEARGEEADRLARAIAAEIPPDTTPSPVLLKRLAPYAWAVAVEDRAGVPFVVTGDLAVAAAPAPSLVTRRWSDWLRPSAAAANVVSGFAGLAGEGRAARVRVDLTAPVLRARARALRILWPLVLGTNLAIVALLLLYFRRWLVPFDRLVARARRALPAEQRKADDVEILLGTFDRALAMLEDRPQADTEGDDLGAFQRALSRSLESGVLLCDHQGSVLALNEMGADLLALPPLDEGGAPLSEVLARHPSLRNVLMDAMWRQKTVRRHEHTIEVDGGSRTLGLTVHPLRRDDGAVRGYLALFADLTVVQRKAEERQLADNLAQVGTLAAGVAHEMRNGLATLRGYFGLIERGPDDDTLHDYLNEMRREGDHLQRVLDDFLRFARPGSLRRERVDVVALARRCAADPALAGAVVEVHAPPSEGSASLQADPQLVEQALRNLVRNAADAQRAAGVETPLVVRVLDRDDEVTIQVDDHGGGLAPEVAANPFDPFVTGRAGGVGLGLALARRVVVLHGGTLGLDALPGGGTRAEIRLPRGAATAEETVEQG